MDILDYSGISFDQNSVLQDATVDSIKDCIMLIDREGPWSVREYPVKLDTVVAIICLKGKMRGTLDLKEFTVEAPGMFIAFSDMILHNRHFSSDFHGMGMVLSKGFWEDFKFDNSIAFPLYSSIKEHPFIKLKSDETESIKEFFKLLQRMIRKHENQNRGEAVKYLTMAFFYGFGYQFHNIPDEINKTKQDVLIEKFLALVRDNYRNYRDPKFYAEKLFLTPKYLSKILKQKSGKSAADWIEEYVILEAKALLMATNKTISQISDEMNFPSQSFFGKYFKRRTNISPREYRKG